MRESTRNTLMRIQNIDSLLDQGDRQGRTHALEILDAG
jgi:hypothetical protein